MKHVTYLIILSVLIFVSGTALAQDEDETNGKKQILSQDGYDEISPAVVKIVSDAGTKIGTGVTVGMHVDEKNKDSIGFILTSYSMVAGRDKVAVILKNHSGGLLGHVVDKWIDFDLDVAIVAVRNFPPGQPMITLGKVKEAESGDIFTSITHTPAGDWVPLPTDLNSIDETHMTFNVDRRATLDGAPLVDQKGSMLGLFVSDETLSNSDIPLASAVRSPMIEPILEEWFRPINLVQKWDRAGNGISKWVWVVGGGVATGTVATVLALSGGDGGGSIAGGLPGAPEPPPPPAGSGN